MRVEADIFDPDDLDMLNSLIKLNKVYPYLKWDDVIRQGLIYWEGKSQ